MKKYIHNEAPPIYTLGTARAGAESRWMTTLGDEAELLPE
jgi:hypothetical protein